MKKILFIILFSIFSQSTFAAETKTYFRADYGLGRFKSDKLDALKANPSGSTMGIAFGSRMSYIEFGGFYRKMSYEADINHDDVANKIVHDGVSFGLDLNFFINNHFSVKLGYAVSSYEQKLGSSVTTTQMNAIKSTYGLQTESKTAGNVFYGLNYDIFGTQRFDLYVSALHFPMGDGKSSTTAQIGIKFYMDSSFADFFGVK